MLGTLKRIAALKREVGLTDEHAASLHAAQELLRAQLGQLSNKRAIGRELEAVSPASRTALEHYLRTLVECALEGPALTAKAAVALFELRLQQGSSLAAHGIALRSPLAIVNTVRTWCIEQLPNPHLAPSCMALAFDQAVLVACYELHSCAHNQRLERLARLGQLTASVAHDLRNPLGVIESSLFMLRQQSEQGPAHAKHHDKISRQLRVSSEIVSGLLELASDTPLDLHHVDVNALLDEAIEQANIPQTVQILRDIKPASQLEADPRLVTRALVNLLRNSARAVAKDGGIVTVHFAKTEHAASLHVSDNGAGFPPDLLPMVFEPLVSQATGGIGLGLALVRSVATRHGGSAHASSPPAGGAAVELRFPRNE